MVKTDKLASKKELQTVLREIREAAQRRYDASGDDATHAAVIRISKTALRQMEKKFEKLSPPIGNLPPGDEDCPEGFVKTRSGDCVPKRPQ